jgi:hypothetical protein
MPITTAEGSSTVLAWERYRERLVGLEGTTYLLEEPLAWADLQDALAAIGEEATGSAGTGED